VRARAPKAGNRLLVAAPLRIEARALRRGAPGMRVLRTGMGPERSRRAVARLRGDPAERVVVAGFCGALEATLEPGQVVVASELRGVARQPLEVPPGLLDALEREGLDVHVAPLASVPRVARGGDRLALQASGAHAVDMESAWLAAGAAGRPFAVVRVVLDGPQHELLRPAFARNLLRAARSLRSVARALDLWVEPQPSQKSVAATRPAVMGEA
jgi:4-hydroxy-3-methylbut-2-enyl diphosphate reductase